MIDALSVGLVSQFDDAGDAAVSQVEKEQITGLFAGLCEECFDFEENHNAPWYCHFDEPWPDNIPGLAAWAYVTLADEQKPAFSLLFSMLFRCLQRVEPADIERFFVEVGSLNLPESGSIIPYGKTTEEPEVKQSKLRRFVGSYFPTVLFPDVRGEGFLDIVSNDPKTSETIYLGINYLPSENISNFWNILAALTNYQERHIKFYPKKLDFEPIDPRLAKLHNPRVISESRKLQIGLWDPVVIGRLYRIIFQALNLAKISSPISIEVCRGAMSRM